MNEALSSSFALELQVQIPSNQILKLKLKSSLLLSHSTNYAQCVDGGMMFRVLLHQSGIVLLLQ